MSNLAFYPIILLLILIPLYPKFPLLGVSGTFVAVRLEDFIIAGVCIWWLAVKLLKRWQAVPHPLHRSVLLYLFIGFISLFSAVFLTKTASLNLGLLHALRRVEYMVLFFAAFDLLRHLNQISFVVRTIILVAALVAIYGLGQQFLGFPVISTTNSEFSKGLALTLGPGARINSTFAGHYDLAAYSVFPLLLILGLLSLPIRHKWLLLLVGTMVYWTMLLSASRVTFAAFYLTAGLFVLVLRRRLWLIFLFVLSVISVLVTPQLLGRYRELVVNHLFSYAPTVSAQTPQPVDEETADALKPPPVPEDRSLNIRLQAEWPKAIRGFLKNPVLGTGYSSVGLAVDNDYLRLLAETGSLGFLAFFLIIIRFFKTSLRYLLTPPRDLHHVFITAITLGFFGLLLNAVFIDVFEASKIAVFTWTIMGITEKTKLLYEA